jgi:hypothetical protein
MLINMYVVEYTYLDIRMFMCFGKICMVECRRIIIRQVEF